MTPNSRCYLEVSYFKLGSKIWEKNKHISYLSCCYCCLVLKSSPDSLRPHWLQSARLFCYMGFLRQEYWSGLPFPSPGDLPNAGIEPTSPSPAPKVNSQPMRQQKSSCLLSILSPWSKRKKQCEFYTFSTTKAEYGES